MVHDTITFLLIKLFFFFRISDEFVEAWIWISCIVDYVERYKNPGSIA